MEKWLEPFYKQNNYKIVYGNPKSKLCLIAFSSNALYNVSTPERNVEQLSRNRFEYENVLNDIKIYKKFNKIIFLRDVTRHFYFKGINDSMNSISNILEFLKQETYGLNCYTIGNSSGGFAATLVGYYLANVKRVYSFGGIINPLDWHGPNFDYNVSDYLKINRMSKEDKEFLRLKKNIPNFSTNFFGVYSHFSLADQSILLDFKYATNKHIKIIEMKTNEHGDYIWSYDYKYIILKNNLSIKFLFSILNWKTISKIGFSILNQGLFCISSKIKSNKSLKCCSIGS